MNPVRYGIIGVLLLTLAITVLSFGGVDGGYAFYVQDNKLHMFKIM